MDRRTVVAGAATASFGVLSGCTEVQGFLFGKTPKKFKIQNDTSSPMTVQVQIEADNQIVLDESYRILASTTTTKEWPNTNATTYTISASTANDKSAFTFDPADWKKRNTPLVLITKDGVEVFVNP